MAVQILLAIALAVSPPRSAAAGGGGGAPAARAASRGATRAPPVCSGEYAQDMSALQARAREFEQRQPPYTFAVRTAAVYECPFYGADGELRRVRKRAVAHGTAFAYRQLQEGGTLLLTNHHVAEWPLATDEDHPVEGVPAGCRRVSVSLKIVDGEDDHYDRDDVALTRVVTDPQLDIAVVKARVTLPVLPWKLGRSSALRERDVVNVRGFPLGVLQADNVGKVVSAFDHDEFKDWDHDDFVVDALLSSGNSGSPVLAISCRTGEFELVGVYHAAYSGGSALNVVVGIDQVRDLMTTLRRTPRARPAVAAQAPARSALVAAADKALDPVFPFGGLLASVRPRSDGTLYFQVFPAEYPVESGPVLVVEDLPGDRPEEFAPLGRVWVGNRGGLKAYDRAGLDGDTQAQLSHVLDALRASALTAFRYRAATAAARDSRERYDEARRLEKALRRAMSDDRWHSQGLADLSERLGPGPADRALRLADVLAAPRPAGLDVAAAPGPAPPVPVAAPAPR
jgi:serine protease Do